uniref:Bifunctional inhibitor/plant lipid transfer protein/seed storage helical domain-containing protein n=1 Tax=Picea sitchensis TaxID=3332 RepID=A9NJW2_PICSI|nr:unknown [Picea sitchensis]
MANIKAMAVILMALWSSFILQIAYGAGECGKTPINTVALSMSPCIGAANNAKVSVPPACCTQVKKVLAMPKCMCAVFLSPIAKQAGINPAVAITIPKRCKIANRSAGKKCGSYIVP